MFRRKQNRQPGAPQEIDFVHHVHTLYSDGISTPMQVIKRAYKKNYRVAITDHNDVRAHVELLLRSQRSPKQCRKIEQTAVPGCEYQTRSKEELLVYALGESYREAAERLLAFHHCIEPYCNAWEPLFDPVDMSMDDFLELAEKHQMAIGVPHFDLPIHGIGNRDTRGIEQAGADFRSYPHTKFVELHQYLSNESNEIALQFALRHGIHTVLAGSDSHNHEHDTSRTRILLPSEEPCNITTMFEALAHTPPGAADRMLARPSKLKILYDGIQIMRNMPWRAKWIQIRNFLVHNRRKWGVAAS